MTKKNKSYALLASFEDVDSLFLACEALRDKGYKSWDAFSPFPVHGLEKAMGLKQSKLPWIVLLIGLPMGILALLTWLWMNGVDYKFVIAGKPFLSWQAYLIPALEVFFLSSAFAVLFGFLGLTKLPRYHHPLFQDDSFSQGVTDGRFFIVVDSIDPLFDKDTTMNLLETLSAKNLKFVES